jgi:hypothetical protein
MAELNSSSQFGWARTLSWRADNVLRKWQLSFYIRHILLTATVTDSASCHCQTRRVTYDSARYHDMYFPCIFPHQMTVEYS